MEKAMAPHSSTLAWKIPWTEEPDGLQSMGSLRVGHDWATSLSLFTCMHWRRNGKPLQCSCLENPRDGGAWWAAVYGVAQSRTRLKRLSSSSRCGVRPEHWHFRQTFRWCWRCWPGDPQIENSCCIDTQARWPYCSVTSCLVPSLSQIVFM